jgi:hypothetical protein
VRVLLDENVPIDLAAAIAGHEVESVAGLGWAGVKNGELLRRMADRFDALLTMDGNLEFQQPIDRQPFGVVLMQARSNRMVDVLPLVPEILRALDGLKPGELRKVRRRP